MTNLTFPVAHQIYREVCEVPWKGATTAYSLDPGVQNEGSKGYKEFCQENTQVIANTLFQQHKKRFYTWTSPDGQHRNQIDYILCSQRWKSFIELAKTRLGADCGSDHELLIAKFFYYWILNQLGKLLHSQVIKKLNLIS